MFVQSAEKVFKSLNGEPFILAFSGGKDSIVMLDIAMKSGVKNIIPIHFYYAENIPSRQKLIRYYEEKYKIKINQEISWYGQTIKMGVKVNQKKIYDKARMKYNVTYIAEGIKKTDSIIRCALIKKSVEGINRKMMTVYPLHRWYDKAVEAYIKQNKLYLPPEYQANVKHDLSNINIDCLDWVKKNLPEDYKVIIAQYPKLKEKEIQRSFYG